MTTNVTIDTFDVTKLSLGSILKIKNPVEYQQIPILYDGKSFFIKTPKLKSLGVYKNEFGGKIQGYSMALICFDDMNDKTVFEKKFVDMINKITDFIRQAVDQLQKQKELKKGGRKHPIDLDNLLLLKENRRDRNKSSVLWPKLIVDKRSKNMSITSAFKQKVDNEYKKGDAMDYEHRHCYVKALLRIDDVYISPSNECIRFKLTQARVESLIATSEFYMGPDMLSDSDED